MEALTRSSMLWVGLCGEVAMLLIMAGYRQPDRASCVLGAGYQCGEDALAIKALCAYPFPPRPRPADANSDGGGAARI
jgi:hypothetical protein